jgi:hypothetical protein
VEIEGRTQAGAASIPAPRAEQSAAKATGDIRMLHGSP